MEKTAIIQGRRTEEEEGEQEREQEEEEVQEDGEEEEKEEEMEQEEGHRGEAAPAPHLFPVPENASDWMKTSIKL